MERMTHHKFKKITRCQRAFTLVELLFCIAIIGIFCALAFPIYKQASTAAQRVKCVSNLTAIGQLLSIYVADNDGQTVPTGTPANNWSEIIGNSRTNGDVYLGYLVPSTSIWRCPENKKQILDFESNWQGEIGCSYTINGFIPPWQAGYYFENRYTSNRVVNFAHPSQLYAVYEGMYNRCQTGTGGVTLARWPHGNSMNILYADGHVEPMKKTVDGLFPGFGTATGIPSTTGNPQAASYSNGIHWMAN